MKKIKSRIVVKLVLGIMGLVLAFIAFSNIWITNTTRDRIFDNPEDVPGSEVALVLGTSKQLLNGNANPYFKFRIETAARLYKLGKVGHFILSGDNQTRFYNEPRDMKIALMKLGVPEENITLDYAGFSTLDSVVRCKKIFGQDKIIIVTQRFHSFRALFIGEFYGMEVAAVTAKDLPIRSSYKVDIREVLARSKTILDLYVMQTSPKYLGEKETISYLY